MRTAWIPVVLSPLVLGGWFAPAMAQDAMSVSPAVTAQPANSPQVAGAARLPGGTVADPTLEKPGLVAGITLGELYTDNVRLAGDDESKDGRFISVIQPFVKGAYNGRHLTGVFDYTLTGYVYGGHSDENQLAQHLTANGTLMMVPQHLFLDGAASYGRVIIDNRAPAGSGTYFLGNNRANVATAMLSPYWVQQLGRVGTMTLRYREGRVVYNRNGITGARGNRLAGISNVTIYGVGFSIVSPKDETWGWALSYTGQRIKPDDGRESLRFARAKVELSRELGLHSRVLVDFGKENRYLPDGTVDTLGAEFWDVGYRWSDRRNTFLIKGGHRFYGHSAELSWTHNASRLTTNVAYVERPTDINQQLLGSRMGLRVNVPRGVSGVPSLLERRVYLMKRASASVDYLMPNGNIRLAVYNESRDFFLRGSGHETVSDAHLAWRFDLGPFTTLTPTVGWQRRRFVDQQVNYTRYAQLEFVHKLQNGDFLSARVRHSSRSVNAVTPGSRGYGANVIYVSWTHLFGGP